MSSGRTAPPSPHPLGDDAPERDQVALAGRAVLAAISFAVAWLAAVAWLTLALVGDGGPASREHIDTSAPYVDALLYGVFLGLPVTAALAWRLLSPINDTWRRGALSVVSVLGGYSLGMVLTFVARQLLESTGLIVLFVTAVLLAVMWGRAAIRLARSEPA